MVTWRTLIAEKTQEPILKCTLSDQELDKPFDDGYGPIERKPFTAWTDNWVFFPIVYDGSIWVGKAPRNPTSEALANPCKHQGCE
jgi:hypothetical protein